MTLPRAANVAPSVIVAAGYVALTAILLWPLPIHLSTVVPHDLGDPILNTWILWWNAHAVPLTERWWNAPIFWPTAGVLGFSEHLLGISILTSPMQWMGASPVTAYNVALLLTFPLSALGAHALGFALTRRHDAALVAGLVFGFNPFRIAQISHLQGLSSYWMPIALLALHQFVERNDLPKRRWLGLFAVAWLLQALSNGYYLLFFPVLVGLWIVWFASRRADVAAIPWLFGAWAIASLPLMPILLKYQQTQSLFDFRRDAGEISELSADLASLLSASPQVRFWTVNLFSSPERELFPGVTAVLLVMLVAGVWLWRAPRPARLPRARTALLVASAVLAAGAVSTELEGPWSIVVGGVKLLSVGAAYKPLVQALVCFAAAMAIDPRVVSAARARSHLLFYMATTVTMFALSLGPEPRFLGAAFLPQAPYAWLMRLPGFDGLRVPARFAMLAVLCLSVAAALAFARLTATARGTMRALAATVVVGGILVDSWVAGLGFPNVPMRVPLLERLPAQTTAVIELPVGELLPDLAAVYRSMYHGHPIVNGYSGYFPPHYAVLQRHDAADDDVIVDALASRGPIVVGIDEGRDPAGRLEKWMTNRPGVVSMGRDSGGALFIVPQHTGPPEILAGPRLAVRSVSSNVESSSTTSVTDGNLRTWWTTGAHQSGGETVTIDLGAAQAVAGVVLSLGQHVLDYPRRLAIDVSADERDWTTVWSGRTAGHALAAAVRSPREVPMSFPLSVARVRLLRLRQLDADPVYYWTIAELAVIGF